MSMRRLALVAGGMLGSMLAVGCAHEPPPIVVYEEPHTSIWLMFDPEAGKPGHDHPVTFTTEQMEHILGGIAVVDRNQVFGEARDFFVKNPVSTPAFTPVQVKTLAPLFVQAFKKASPVDMVTFYLLTGNKAVTSGGLFVRNGLLYFILANFRTSPATKTYETTYEIEARDMPLLPVARFLYLVGFRPSEAWIPSRQARGTDGYERYMDESKLVIVDLERLSAISAAPPATSLPTAR